VTHEIHLSTHRVARLEKGLEDVGLFVVWNANAEILDLQNQQTLCRRLSLNIDSDYHFFIGMTELESVLDQIDKDLVRSHLVNKHADFLGLPVDLQVDFLLPRMHPHHVDNFVHHVVQLANLILRTKLVLVQQTPIQVAFHLVF